MDNEVLHDFHEQELQTILLRLLRCNSENPGQLEEPIARVVRDMYMEEGIEATLIPVAEGRANVMATISAHSDGKVLLLNGHLDVVPAGNGWRVPPFSGHIDGDKVYGRGAADMKGGLAAMIYASILLHRHADKWKGKVMVYFTADEERENLGMKTFIDSPIQADYAVVGEPTNLQVCNGHKGVARLRLTTFGESVHAAIGHSANHAIYHMNKLVTSLEELSLQEAKRTHPSVGHASITVTQIKGGTAPNMIPDTCTIEIDCRTLPHDDEAAVYDKIRRFLQLAIKEFKEERISFDLKLYLFLPAYYLDPMHPLVQAMDVSARQVNHARGGITSFPATCEASYIMTAKNIPTVIFGPGSLQQAHTIDEFISFGQVRDACLAYVNLAQRSL